MNTVLKIRIIFIFVLFGWLVPVLHFIAKIFNRLADDIAGLAMVASGIATMKEVGKAMELRDKLSAKAVVLDLNEAQKQFGEAMMKEDKCEEKEQK